MKLSGARPKPKQQLAAFAQDSDDEDGAGGADPATAQEIQQLKAEGQAHAEKEDWSKALSTWDRALAHNPPNAHEFYELRAQTGRDFEAIQAATKATQLSPAYVPAFVTLGRAQLNYGEPKLALKSFQRVLQIEPSNTEVAQELSVVQMLSLQQERAGPGKRATVTDGAAAGPQSATH